MISLKAFLTLKTVEEYVNYCFRMSLIMLNLVDDWQKKIDYNQLAQISNLQQKKLKHYVRTFIKYY